MASDVRRRTIQPPLTGEVLKLERKLQIVEVQICELECKVEMNLTTGRQREQLQQAIFGAHLNFERLLEAVEAINRKSDVTPALRCQVDNVLVASLDILARLEDVTRVSAYLAHRPEPIETCLH